MSRVRPFRIFLAVVFPTILLALLGITYSRYFSDQKDVLVLSDNTTALTFDTEMMPGTQDVGSVTCKAGLLQGKWNGLIWSIDVKSGDKVRFFEREVPILVDKEKEVFYPGRSLYANVKHQGSDTEEIIRVTDGAVLELNK